MVLRCEIEGQTCSPKRHPCPIIRRIAKKTCCSVICKLLIPCTLHVDWQAFWPQIIDSNTTCRHLIDFKELTAQLSRTMTKLDTNAPSTLLGVFRTSLRVAEAIRTGSVTNGSYDGRRKFPTWNTKQTAIALYAPFNACSKSAIRSPESSMPTESRTVASETPSSRSCFFDSPVCDESKG